MAIGERGGRIGCVELIERPLISGVKARVFAVDSDRRDGVPSALFNSIVNRLQHMRIWNYGAEKEG